MSRTALRLVAAAIAIGLIGCSSGPIPVRLISRQDSTPALQDLPELVLLPTMDERADRGNDGQPGSKLGALVTTSDSVVVWVESEVLRQLREHYTVTRQESADAPVMTVQFAVKACYVQPVGSTASAQLILELRRFKDGGQLGFHIIRGRSVGSIWVSFKAQIATGLRRALEDAVAQGVRVLGAPTAAEGARVVDGRTR